VSEYTSFDAQLDSLGKCPINSTVGNHALTSIMTESKREQGDDLSLYQEQKLSISEYFFRLDDRFL